LRLPREMEGPGGEVPGRGEAVADAGGARELLPPKENEMRP
jgi:hypothetical protein